MARTNGNPKSRTSSGNVFADLGFQNSDEMLAKSNLALQIQRIMQERQLDQTQAGKLMGIDQSKVSKILLGKLSGVSMERLIRCLNALDHDVELRIKPKPKNRAKAKLRVYAGQKSNQ